MGEISVMVPRVLSEEELFTIPEHVRKKIEDFIRTINQEKISSEALLTSWKYDHEQRVSELEEELSSQQQEYFNLKQELGKVLRDRDDLMIKLQSTQTEMVALQKRLEITEKQCQSFKLNQDAAVEERDKIRRELEQMSCERDLCKSEVNSLSVKLEAARKEFSSLITQYGDMESKKKILDEREENFETEREILVNQANSLKQELKSRMEQNSFLENKFWVKCSEFDTVIGLKDGQIKIVEEANSELNSSVHKLKEQFEHSKQEFIRECERREKMEESHLMEMRAQKKIVSEYEGLLENESSRARDIEQKLQQTMQELEAERRKNKTIVEELDQLGKRYEEMEEQMNAEKSKLIEELEVANDVILKTLEDQLEQDAVELFPVIASAKRMLKPGTRYTQICHDQFQLLAELERLQKQNDYLNEYMDSVIKEIEDKTLSLTAQREQFEEAIRQNELLEEHCKKLLMEVITLRQQAQAAKRTNSSANDCDEQMEQCDSDTELSALSGQQTNSGVGEKSSLGAVEAHVLNYLKSRPRLDSLDSRNVSCSQKRPSINRNASYVAFNEQRTPLLPFGSNNPILNRMLTSTPNVYASQVEENTSVVHHLMKELHDELKNQKHIKIKDMAVQTDELTDEIIAKLHEEIADREAALQELQSKLGHEVHLRQQLEEIRTHAATLGAQLHVAQESLKIAQANATTYKTKLVETDKKNRNYSVTMTQQENSLQQLKSMVESMQKRVEQANMQLASLQQENQCLRNAEVRRIAQQEMLDEAKAEKQRLSARIDKLQDSLEKSEAEGMLHLRQCLAKSAAECADLKQELRKMEADMSHQIKSLKSELEKARSESLPLHQQIESLELQLVERDVRLEDLSAVISKRPAEIKQVQETDVQTNYASRLLKERELELSNCKITLETTQQLLETSRKHAVIYKDFSLKLEKELQNLTEEYNSYKEETKKRDAESMEKENCLKQQICQLQHDLEIAREFEVKLQECRKELENCQSELIKLKADLQEERSQKIAVEVKYSEILLQQNENENALRISKEEINSLERELQDLRVLKDRAESLLQCQNEQWQNLTQEWKQEQQKMVELLNVGQNKNLMLYKQLNEISTKAVTDILAESVKSLKRKRPDDSNPETDEASKKDEDTTETGDEQTSPPNKKMLISNVRSITSEDMDAPASETQVATDNKESESEELQQVITKFDKFRKIITSLHLENIAVNERAKGLELEADSLRLRAERQQELLNSGQQKLSKKQDMFEEDFIILSKKSNLLKDETLSSVTEANLRLCEERGDLEKQNRVMRERSAALEARVAEGDKTELELEKKKVQELKRILYELEKKHKQTVQNNAAERRTLLREKETLRRTKRRKNEEIRLLRKQLKLALSSSYKTDDSQDHIASGEGEGEADDYALNQEPEYEEDGRHQHQEAASEDEVCLVDIADEDDSAAQSTEPEYQDPEYSAENAEEYPETEDPEYSDSAQYEDHPEDPHYHGDNARYHGSHDTRYPHDADDPEYSHPNGEGDYADTDGHSRYHCGEEQDYGDEEHEDGYAYEDDEYREPEEPGEIMREDGVPRVERSARHLRVIPSEEEMDEDEEEAEDNVVTVLDSEDADCEDSAANENLQRLLRSGNISLVTRKERPVNSDVSGVGRKLAETSSDDEGGPGHDKVGHRVTRRQSSGTAKRARSWRGQRSSTADSGS